LLACWETTRLANLLTQAESNEIARRRIAPVAEKIGRVICGRVRNRHRESGELPLMLFPFNMVQRHPVL
jgi:hypothetical protein